LDAVKFGGKVRNERAGGGNGGEMLNDWHMARIPRKLCANRPRIHGV